MHHPKTRPVFEPVFICHRNSTITKFICTKHKLWSCLIKHGHNIYFGVNKSTCRAVSMTNKKWFKNAFKGGAFTGFCSSNYFLFVQREAMLIPVINHLTSLYGGFLIFSVIGFISEATGLSVDDVISSGEIKTHFPFANPFITIYFKLSTYIVLL